MDPTPNYRRKMGALTKLNLPPQLKTTFHLDMVSVKKNPQSSLYTTRGVGCCTGYFPAGHFALQRARAAPGI